MGEAHIKFVCLVESRDRRTRTSVQGLDSSAIAIAPSFVVSPLLCAIYQFREGLFLFSSLSVSEVLKKFLSICSLFWNV